MARSCGPGGSHARHSRHVSQTGLNMSSLALSRPAACRIARILGSLACHQRKCNFLSSFWITAGFQDLRLRRLVWVLKRVQSGSCDGPDPVSVNVRLVLGSVFPRSTGAESVEALPGS